MSQTDHLDFICGQWAEQLPDLNTDAMQLIGRVYRLYHYLLPEIEACHKRFGLNFGEFDVIATLLRSGDPWTLTPTELFQSAMLSSGAMTNRLNRLEKAGLISRKPSATDRRSLLVVLTFAGRAVAHRAVIAHMENLNRLTAHLAKQDKQLLTGQLRSWLLGYELPDEAENGQQNDDGDEDSDGEDTATS
ncbi:MarR family winged helix-turn-helix transcriptional regulator [Oceanobacter mangrovi]|uniref:MarR family winged helix-turn-helix transcriptional regulator n=1 Tax=Oceanobacter mangrovi TaxID=2862510 RepID=UPI001C8CF571|nr:MarR family transcriptional regulator [Oceanobacter mangrovi]